MRGVARAGYFDDEDLRLAVLRVDVLRPPVDLRDEAELFFAPPERDRVERDDEDFFAPPLREDDAFFFVPLLRLVEDDDDFFLALPLFDDEAFLPFAPPVSLLTVAQARRAASFVPTPFFS